MMCNKHKLTYLLALRRDVEAVVASASAAAAALEPSPPLFHLVAWLPVFVDGAT